MGTSGISESEVSKPVNFAVEASYAKASYTCRSGSLLELSLMRSTKCKFSAGRKCGKSKSTFAGFSFVFKASIATSEHMRYRKSGTKCCGSFFYVTMNENP